MFDDTLMNFEASLLDIDLNYSDIYVSEDFILESNDYMDDEAKKKINQISFTKDDRKGGKGINSEIYKYIFRAIFSKEARQGGYEYLRTKRLPRLIKACKDINEVNYLRKDSTMAIYQMEALLRNIEAVKNNDQTKMKRLSKSFIKKVQNGEINEQEIKKHIQWLKTDYKKMLNDRAKELK